MKRLFLLFTILFFIAGCDKDDQLGNSTNQNSRVFTASFETATKTSVDGSLKLSWDERDYISIFSSTQNSRYIFQGATGDISGEFLRVDNIPDEGSPISTNYAVYPYSETTHISITDDKEFISLALPESQLYAGNSFGPGANTMVAASSSIDDTFLPFKNLCGFIRLQLYGENIIIQSIKLEGLNGEVLAGTAEVVATYSSIPEMRLLEESGTTSLTLDCGDGVVLGATEDKSTLFWLVVPPVNFEKGFSVTITDKSGNVVKKSTNKQFSVERNVLKTMAAFEFVPKKSPEYEWYISSENGIYDIDTPEELFALSKLSNGDADALSVVGESSAVTFEGKTVNITADIDLKAYCSEGVESWRPIQNFYGTFNGNGHLISNFYCDDKGQRVSSGYSMGLFDNINNAVISDIKIQGKINCDYNQSTIGGICGSSTNTTFINCRADVIINSSFNSYGPSHSFGGVCGTARSAVFIACETNVDIDNDQTIKAQNAYFGGIVGYANSCNLVACMSHGAIYENNPSRGYSYVGGVLGYIMQGDYTRIYACYSSCDVKSRQPGLILGAYGPGIGEPNICNSYYSAKYSGKGVGTKFYSGQEYSYDYGTIRLTDVNSAIEAMNETIEEWNLNFSNMACNYRYVIGGNNELSLRKVQ